MHDANGLTKGVEYNELKCLGNYTHLSFPHVFIRWIMLTVFNVSYKYMVNGETPKFMIAKRGLRQGDHISPIIFVIVMEYMHKVLSRLHDQPNFNFHSRCEKLSIINLTFVDDLLFYL